MKNKAELIVALDNVERTEAIEIADELAEIGVRWFKVGLEMYTKAGPLLAHELKKKGYNVFLDLKLHDIPNTVAKSVRAAAELNVDLLTIHCAGGKEMLSQAQKAAEGSRLSLLGVTVLTSLSDEELGGPRGQLVANAAKLAAESGLAGIVCSGSDLIDDDIKGFGWRLKSPLFVTPGIRDQEGSVHDQKSVATPEFAINVGATHLVVGRPIMKPESGTRVEMAKKFLGKLNG